MWANFISHCDEGAIFHNFRKEIISHSATPNISLKAFDSKVFRIFVCAFRVCRQIRTDETVEMFTMLWYIELSSFPILLLSLIPTLFAVFIPSLRKWMIFLSLYDITQHKTGPPSETGSFSFRRKLNFPYIIGRVLGIRVFFCGGFEEDEYFAVGGVGKSLCHRHRWDRFYHIRIIKNYQRIGYSVGCYIVIRL